MNDERTTPRWFFDKVDEQFRFTLDAAAILFIDKRFAFDDEKSSAKFCSWLALFNGSAKDIARLRKLNMGVVK